MSLTTPKRLFNIKSMTTVMYEDVEVERYAAVSHVWGNQTKYKPEELGICGGVDWEVPLSYPNKISRIKAAMEIYGLVYCWFDVLCMPQDKQDEINLEIPFMGDYYAGADVTIVLSDETYVVSDDFSKWYSIAGDMLRGKTPTKAESKFLQQRFDDNLLIPTDAWFTRVWTLQEAVLSKLLVLVDNKGSISTLSSLLGRLYHFNKVYIAQMVFGSSAEQLLKLQSGIESAVWNTSLAKISSVRSIRDCYKAQDKFYGMLGILGYKDFVVDYNISPEELNKKIVQYAYSKGDLSWVSLMGSAPGFIQPMYEESKCIGENWVEDAPKSCGLVFENDALYLNVCAFAKITYKEKFVDEEPKMVSWCVDTFKNLGFNMDDIVDVMSSYIHLSDNAIEILKMQLEYLAGYLDKNPRDMMPESLKDGNLKENIRTTIKILGDLKTYTDVNICKAISFGEEIPLLICGNVNVGDDIMLVRMHDNRGRCLAIVSSGSQRKSVFLYKWLDISDDDVDEYYQPYKFML